MTSSAIPKSLFTVALAAALAVPAGAAGDEPSFDQPGIVKASEILPPDLVKNEHFTVREDVSWFDGLHLFTVDTEYGAFEIWGEPMLRVRLKEFIAWNELHETSSAEAGVRAVGRTALESVDSLLNAFAHPVTTIKGVPQGISRMFRNIGRDLGKVVDFVTGHDDGETVGKLDRGDDESNEFVERAEKLAGVNSSYRRWAQKAGVNPYTSNPALQDELNRLAKSDAYLGTGAWLLAPASASGTIEIVAKVAKSVYDKDWREVLRDNRKALQALGADEARIAKLFANPYVNLSTLSLVVETLGTIEGAADRVNVADQLSLLQSEAEVIWFAESIMMAQWFHQNEAPIASFLPDTLVPVALTADGRVIAFSATDFAYWDEATAIVVAEFVARYEKYSSRGEVWLADQVSPRFEAGLSRFGWTLRSGMRSTHFSEVPWALQDDGK